MSKDIEKKLVGQPLLTQIMDLIPKELFDKLILEHLISVVIPVYNGEQYVFRR
jgi:hypothetical protein